MGIPVLTKRQLMRTLDRDFIDTPIRFTSLYFGEKLAYIRSMLKSIVNSVYDIRGCINLAPADGKSQAFVQDVLAVIVNWGGSTSNNMTADPVTGRITIQKTGWYLHNVHMSYSGDVNTTEYEIFVYVNGVRSRMGGNHTIKLATEHESIAFN